MAHKFPVVPDIGLKVHDTFSCMFDAFDEEHRFYVRSQSEANISRSCLMYYKEMWDEKLCPKVNQEDVVMDVGAHVGFFSIPISHLAKMVTAFEPSPANFKLLARNIKRNKRSNVLAIESAVGNVVGKVKFHLGVQGTTGHSVQTVKRGGVSVEVAMTTLADQSKTYPPTVLKIDGEGAEWDILVNPKDLKPIRLIVAELHKVEKHDLKGMLGVLEQAGFRHQEKGNSWFTKLVAYKE